MEIWLRPQCHSTAVALKASGGFRDGAEIISGYGQAQAIADVDLNQRPTPERPELDDLDAIAREAGIRYPAVRARPDRRTHREAGPPQEGADDFDVVGWQVEDRASRSGGEHGMWLQHELKRAGIRVYFAGDDQPTGPYAPVVRVAKYEAAKEVSLSNGRRSSQGQQWAQKEGFFRTAGPAGLAASPRRGAREA